jgi:GAF domain-containing protein/HAMP domain-containing protein
MNRLQRFLAWFGTGHIIRRPVAVLMLVVLPIMIGITYFVGAQANNLLRQEALSKLQTLNRSVAHTTTSWLNFNNLALRQLVQQEEIWQMDAQAQKPALEVMTALYPYMYLVSTTDLNGMNVARSDTLENKDYSTRTWFTQARDGSPVTYQILIGATTGQPSVVVSTPIRNEDAEIVGVGMFSSDLDVLSSQVQASPLGQTGATFIIDDVNRIIAHPDPLISAELRDASDFPAVKKLRQGYDGVVHFEDAQGLPWVASVTLLENGWGVISQQQEQEIFAPITHARDISLVVVVGGLLVIFVSFILVARTVIRPISNLTETALAISKGDLRSRARVENRDELGILAQSFNDMADQLQAIQTNLEQQVAHRTAELQARSTQLEASAAQLRQSTSELDERSSYLQTLADVSRIIATILDPDELMRRVVELTRERFNLYYVGLFLVDANRERAWLRAGTGQAGQAMLARKHAIEIGTGMIGWSIEHAEPRIALQAGEDEVRLATPDLPETRSEAALPLRSRDVVIGALSIQSAVPNDFHEENITLFQMLADQVAVALDNARLYRQSQEALQSLREAYGQQSAEGWQRLLRTRTDLAYRCDASGVAKAPEVWYPEMDVALAQSGLAIEKDADSRLNLSPLALPIKVRGQVVGVLDARKEVESGRWLPEEVTLVQTVVEQLGVAIESAQLYQETQNRAERERLVSEITGKLRASNDPQVILQTAAAELRRALHSKDAHVLLRGVPVPKNSTNDETNMQE